MTNRLGRLLFVTLEAARVDAELPVLAALRSWLNSWRGIGGGKVYGVGIPGRGFVRQGGSFFRLESSWLAGSWSHIPAPEREAGP